jgi:hypothetical protein
MIQRGDHAYEREAWKRYDATLAVAKVSAPQALLVVPKVKTGAKT